MNYITLGNGIKMPMLGCGTYQIEPKETETAVLTAISKGYRLIDTSQGYFNEESVGNAILKCGVPRDQLFISDKIWISNGGYDRAKDSIDESLIKLKTDYVDLMLIHQPFHDYYGIYRAMEDAYRAGKIRAIGVSNFMPDRFIDIANFVDIAPVVNQLEFHALCQQKTIRPILGKYGTCLMGWAPLAEAKERLMNNKVLKSLADQHGVTVAQVALRFTVQSGIPSIPKSVHHERLEENMKVLDFKLSEKEMKEIQDLDAGKSVFLDHYAPEVAEMFVSAGKI